MIVPKKVTRSKMKQIGKRYMQTQQFQMLA